jgi:hypothetical protein
LDFEELQLRWTKPNDVLIAEKSSSSDASVDEGSGSLHMSSKVHTLISILQSYRLYFGAFFAIVYLTRIDNYANLSRILD